MQKDCLNTRHAFLPRALRCVRLTLLLGISMGLEASATAQEYAQPPAAYPAAYSAMDADGPPTIGDASIPNPADATPAASAAGAALYRRKCSRCHVLYSPSQYSPRAWPIIVRSMKSQAGLNESDIQAISRYLVAASGGGGSARAGMDERLFGSGEGAGLDTSPVIGGYLYTEYFKTSTKAKNFDIHYLAVSVSGWVNEQIQYYGEFELEHGGKDDNTFVEQAYLDYWFRPNVAVKIGAILTPFNRFDDFHDPLGNYLVTRPQVSREIGVSAWKDVGVDLHGHVDLGCNLTAIYDVYMINGLGAGSNLRGSRHYRDNNESLGFGGRVRAVFCDRYEVGFSGYQGAWDDDALFDVRLLGCHFLAHTEWADFYGEWSWGISENPLPTERGRMNGYFVQASRLICEKYRPSVRVGSLDYLDPGNQLGRSALKGNMDLTEVGLCFGFYPTPRVVFKFEYLFLLEGARVAEADNDQFGFQAAVRF